MCRNTRISVHVHGTNWIGFAGKSYRNQETMVLAKAEGKFKNKREPIQWHMALGSGKDTIWKKSGETQMLINRSLSAFIDFCLLEGKLGILISVFASGP